METSILIAKLFWTAYFIVWISILFNPTFYIKVLEDFWKNKALYFIMSMIPLIIGLLMVIYHNTWESDWTVLITLLAWAALIKWTLLFIFPKFHLNIISKMKTSSFALVAWWIFATLVWAFLAYMGFMS